MLEFLIGRRGGDKETFFVAGSKAPDYPGTCYRSMANGYDVLEFGFENTVACSVNRRNSKRVPQRRYLRIAARKQRQGPAYL